MSLRLKQKAATLLLVHTSLIGCGAANVAKPAASSCPKAKVQTSQLHLKSTSDSELTAGLGYLDIHTTDNAGNALSRRCTASIWPSDFGVTEVDIYTSGHCFFEPDSEEYKNSKFILQVAYNGGYFPVEAKMPVQEVFGAFSRSMIALKDALPQKLRRRLDEAIGPEMLSSCQSGTQTFAQELGDTRKTIACFGKNESRSVHLVLNPRKEQTDWLTKVFDASRANIRLAFSLLPEREQKIIQIRLDSKKYQNTLELNLKEFAYILNEKHCSLSPEELSKEFVGPQTQDLCKYRLGILPGLKSTLKDLYSEISPIVDAENQTLDELKSLHRELFSCRFSTLTDINLETVKVAKNVCEVEQLSRLIWNEWVASGPDNLVSKLTLNRAKISNAGFSVFGLKTNSLDSAKSVDSGRVGRSRPVVSEISEINGMISAAKLNNQSLMFNYDPEKINLFLMKKDSGSTLNLLNVFPLATLTTLDGNPTSGGTAVLPLPPVDDDADLKNCQ